MSDIEKLELLAKLYQVGVLNQEEFAAARARLLDQLGTVSGNALEEIDNSPITEASFTNADRVRILANLPPKRMIWGGLALMAWGYVAGPHVLAVLGGVIFFIGLVFNDIKPPS